MPLTVGSAALRQAFSRPPLLPVGILIALVVVALAPGLISPSPPTRINIAARLQPPLGFGGALAHPLGTDQLGRDVLSRLAHGARISVAVGFISVLAAGVIGLVLGLVGSYLRGVPDAVVMRAAEIMLSIPVMLLALAIIGAIGASLRNLIIVLVAVNWARYARLVRGEVLRLRERAFVELAEVAGASALRIMGVHLLPNVLNAIVVLASLDLGRIIILEASMSFLGIGVPPPTPSWGLMMADGRGYLATAWWLAALPGLAILLTCLATNQLGDWLRDRLDPQLRPD